jgi:regulation of enolase protein 1 (concanavalin A-like superfamily)
MCRKSIYVALLLLTLGLAQAKEVVWQKAVYSDSRYATAWQGNSDATRDALVAAGYTLLNADQLKTWMNARIADKAFSVVVFCRDAAPDTVTETMSNTCTLRKYLDAGGKIVWYGDIPFYYQSNATATNTTWGDAGAPAILGFNTAGATRETYNDVTITPLGKAWGLTQTWQSRRPATPSALAPGDILATDNAGNAAAWVKHYVPNDTFRGFVRISDHDGQANVQDIMRVAEYVAVKAWNPMPANGQTAVTAPLMTWNAGPFALWHDVYFGTSPTPGDAEHIGKQMFTMYYNVAGLQPGKTYYWRIDEIEADGTVYKGDVWSFTAAPTNAWAPNPGDGAAYVALNAALQWTAGMNATTHDVYFSADRAAVESGAAAAKKADKQPTTSYAPTGLESGKTYYWRVDEVLVNGSKVTGPVWSFTVRPVIAKTDPTLVGWWKLDDEKSNVAVDYSGYDNYGTLAGGVKFVPGYLGDALSFDGATGFVDCGNDASLSKVDSVSVAAWIQVGALGRDQKVGSNQNNSTGGYKLGVFTTNVVEFEIRTAANAATLNRNVAGGTVLQQGVWYHVVGVYNKGKSIRTYINGKLDRELLTPDVAGISTGPFRLGRESFSAAYWFLGLMDDVRVYNKALTDTEIQKVMQGDPLMAWSPQPTSGANVDIRNATNLTWSAGDNAAKHDVYLGKDKDTVKAANTTSPLYQGRQTGTSFALAGLVDFGGGSYFWRIDEVEADGTTVHKGIVWTFTVPGYLIVDEFENYTDADGNRIYQTWIDGWTNGTGSVVGNLQAPFAEQTIVHSGKQAMPMDYNNTKSPFYSEAELDFAPVQDWTGYGVNTLSLWFRGQAVAFRDKGGNAYTVSGSGNDIWNAADAFRFAYKSLSGNGSITARVDSLVRSDAWSKAGVMIRETLDTGSKHAASVVTPDNGVSFPYRNATAGTSNQTNVTGVAAPYWVRITRTGNVFKSETSPDGKTWTQLGTDTTITMAATVDIGLAVTAHNAAATSTAEFSNVTTTGTVTGSWAVAAIGTDPEPANSPASLYVAVEDSAGKVVIITNADPSAVLTMTYTEWKIPLSSLTGVNLAKVKKLYIGVGDRKAPVPDGNGRIFIDDIRVTKP